MKGRLGALAPLLVFVAVVAIAGIVLLQGGARRDPSETGMIGRVAPPYALADLDGEGVVTPADFAGRAYVVNVFASWCAPCRIEHPVLMALEAGGAPILGIAYKDAPEDTRDFLNGLGDPYAAVGLDPDGRYGLEIGVAGVPETFVIGPDGTILALHRGPLDAGVVERVILPALSAP
jgi:cytochrome c biogenesis protein CcmG/thiol:disulfide interchange protein DsbE